MSISDVIYILPSDFRALGIGVECCEKITATYNHLLTHYDCFTKPEALLMKFTTTANNSSNTRAFSNRTHLNVQSQKHEKYHGIRVTSFHSTRITARVISQHHFVKTTSHVSVFTAKRTKIGNTSDDPQEILKRQLKGHMNIISNNNYSKISAKIQRLLMPQYIEDVIRIILDTACLQVFYVSIFYRLLCDVVDNFQGDIQTTERVQSTVDKYIVDFIENREFMFQSSNQCDQSTKNTPWFYQQQKHKMLASSKGIVVLELLRNEHSTYWNVPKYSQILLEELMHLHDEDNETSEEIKELNIDVILSLLRDIKTKFSQIAIDNSLMKEMKRTKSCQRIRFMIDDIMALQTA